MDVWNDPKEPLWPKLLLPFTARGRKLLADTFLGSSAAVLGIEETDDVIETNVKCYNCVGTTLKNGQCVCCGVMATSIVKCIVCGQDQALPAQRPFYHACAGCGKMWVAN